jgi:hypothetical protein
MDGGGRRQLENLSWLLTALGTALGAAALFWPDSQGIKAALGLACVAVLLYPIYRLLRYGIYCCQQFGGWIQLNRALVRVGEKPLEKLTVLVEQLADEKVLAVLRSVGENLRAETASELLSQTDALPDNVAELRYWRRFFDASSEIFDLCSRVENAVSQIAAFKPDASPKATATGCIEGLLPEIARLFRTLTQHEVCVLIQGRSKSNPKNLQTLLTAGSPRRQASQPENVEVRGTIPGDVLESGIGLIQNCGDRLSVDQIWPTRSDFVKSFIVWPIKVGRDVQAVLKIDANQPNVFEDNQVTRICAEFCARKIALVYLMGRGFQLSADSNTEVQRDSSMPVSEPVDPNLD